MQKTEERPGRNNRANLRPDLSLNFERPMLKGPFGTFPLRDILSELERKILWLSTWTIHHANHLRAEEDAIKVGGHQASSASLVSIMTALYFGVLKPEDRVAVKPHASPVFHAIQYLLGNQTRVCRALAIESLDDILADLEAGFRAAKS